MRARCAAAAAFWLAAAAQAQAAPAVAILGRVAHPQMLSEADLERLPAVTETVRFDTEHGPESATFKGALLWTVLGRAGLTDQPGRRTRLRHTLLATGQDGYGVALALGEIDPAFEGKRVIIAYERDGRSLAAPRLMVPGDAHGGRSVRDLVSIEVR